MGQEAGEGREDVASAGQQVRRERLLPLVELEDFQGEASPRKALEACPEKHDLRADIHHADARI